MKKHSEETVKLLEAQYSPARLAAMRAHRIGLWVTEDESRLVSTMDVKGSKVNRVKQYETVVQFREFHDGEPIPVAACDTKEEAEALQAKWVAIAEQDELPDEISSVINIAPQTFKKQTVEDFFDRLFGTDEGKR